MTVLTHRLGDYLVEEVFTPQGQGRAPSRIFTTKGYFRGDRFVALGPGGTRVQRYTRNTNPDGAEIEETRTVQDRFYISGEELARMGGLIGNPTPTAGVSTERPSEADIGAATAAATPRRTRPRLRIGGSNPAVGTGGGTGSGGGSSGLNFV